MLKLEQSDGLSTWIRTGDEGQDPPHRKKDVLMQDIRA